VTTATTVGFMVLRSVRVSGANAMAAIKNFHEFLLSTRDHAVQSSGASVPGCRRRSGIRRAAESGGPKHRERQRLDLVLIRRSIRLLSMTEVRCWPNSGLGSRPQSGQRPEADRATGSDRPKAEVAPSQWLTHPRSTEADVRGGVQRQTASRACWPSTSATRLQ